MAAILFNVSEITTFLFIKTSRKLLFSWNTTNYSKVRVYFQNKNFFLKSFGTITIMRRKGQGRRVG